jgi:C-5 cytosine-specific DNA methylase
MTSEKPLAIDLYAGLGGWTEGLLAEGYHARGYDIEAHEYGEEKYPGELILADVMTLHGSQFADAALIVASPPCQEFSYMAMPWSRAKQIARALRGQDTFPEGYTGSRTIAELTALFDACFRIQREASEAAGRHVPMVVENVRGAVPWVGPAAWNYGSYYLWGDVPALMPATLSRKTFGHPNKRDGHGHTKRLTNPAEHCICPTECECQAMIPTRVRAVPFTIRFRTVTRTPASASTDRERAFRARASPGTLKASRAATVTSATIQPHLAGRNPARPAAASPAKPPARR